MDCEFTLLHLAKWHFDSDAGKRVDLKEPVTDLCAEVGILVGEDMEFEFATHFRDTQGHFQFEIVGPFCQDVAFGSEEHRTSIRAFSVVVECREL